MSLRDVLAALVVPADGTDTPTATPAFAQALALGRAAGAHVDAIVSAPKIVPVYSPVYAGFAASLAADVNAKTEASATRVAETLKGAAAIAGVAANVDARLEDIENAAAHAARVGRSHDLVVVDAPQAVLDSRAALFEGVLFHSGRPVLVATSARAPVETVTRLMVAWDGSAHAARAVHDALYVFPGIETIEVVSVVGEKDLSKSLAGADVARHLSRARTTTLTELPLTYGSVAKTLDAHAVASGADMLAMGGYGHSRWREFVLGGVTLELTRSARVPLLMSY